MTNQLVPQGKGPILPALPSQILPALTQLTSALGIPREALAPDEEIEFAWRDLPRELASIPPRMRGELMARMCVAVATGLFDGAINYAWNATILNLRQMVREFGLPIVSKTLQAEFEERELLELQDSQLLELSLKLGLISEDGYFFLDQCRDTRNNFSAAHPTIGKINDREFMVFLNRCVRYALAGERFPRGVDVGAFIGAVKGQRFIKDQVAFWIEKLEGTHDAQRELLFGSVHGIYCDPATSEPGRLNALDLCIIYAHKFSAGIRSDLVARHGVYVARGDQPRQTASRLFFEKAGLLPLLTDSERHGILTNAITGLWTVHQGMDNFYNEPPFAERLRRLSEQGPIPDTAQEEYVRVVIGCLVGNGYGVSWAAVPKYESMVRGFSPREVSIMVSLPKTNTVVGRRIQSKSDCQDRFVAALRLIDRGSVPRALLADYDSYFQSVGQKT